MFISLRWGEGDCAKLYKRKVLMDLILDEGIDLACATET